MRQQLTLPSPYSGTLLLDYMPLINYAMMQRTEGMIFSSFTLRNDSDEIWDDVHITFRGEMLEPCEMSAMMLHPGQSMDFPNARLMPVAVRLMALSEALQTSFTIAITVHGEPALEQTLPLTLMAFDQWTGSTVMPELLASFVTPNHPCIGSICRQATQHLKETTGNADLFASLSEDPMRILYETEAIYHALLDQQLTYATCPASFEESGQRIRLCDKVLTDRMGNCIELSLLLCSCLESIGLHAVLIVFQTHVIMGVWTEIRPGTPAVGYDRRVIEDALNGTMGKLVLIEATALTSGLQMEEAMKMGEATFGQKGDQFEFYLDVSAARQEGIRPLPHCIQSEQGWELTGDDIDVLVNAEKEPFGIHGTAETSKLRSKQLLWERKLLDLSLRNNLLNMKMGKRIVPLKPLSIEGIMLHLAEGEIVADFNVSDCKEAAKELYRTARTSLEENGANTLFLSIGTLRWYEENGQRPYLAPILFMPVEIVRHPAKKYLIRPRDEEPIMNITLLEMLRQTFELTIPPLHPVPTDENETVDWRRVFRILKAVIANVNDKRPADAQWEISEDCAVGIFSFTKFVMWNDIHSHPEVLEAHPLLHSLMEGRLLDELIDNAPAVSARELDETAQPADFALPVDVDSSQLEAVVESGRGNSFILYGPPGTGKSQTITNMIANALYQNKRVLFVAEKKAALEVVQERLRRIGLEPFCLELHSNKVDKKSFINQMEMAVSVAASASSPTFLKNSEELFARRQELNAYIQALHCKRADNLSLYDYINRYSDVPGAPMPLSYAEVRELSLEQMEALCEEYESLDKVQLVLGEHPGRHPLLGLILGENTADNQHRIEAAIPALLAAIPAARKKADGLLNRWFGKRTPLELLQQSAAWQDFFALADTDTALKDDIGQLEAALTQWNAHADKLRNWYIFSQHARQLNALGCHAAKAHYMQGSSGHGTAQALRKGYYLRLALSVVDNDAALRSFNGLLFEDIIKKYRNLTRKFQKLTKQELVSRLTQQMPKAETADEQTREELTFLKKRIAARGRAYSVRRILDQTRHILPQLCPCMLMSPLSVAQYLDMVPDQFDLIIFDEASQMPTSEAVGAIARGKAAVVVGDPKQMPPTSFFNAASTSDDDIDIDDMESILNDCISLSMPGRYLSWHYRSRHESLIAFSNMHFYDNRLVTFPSVDDQDRKLTLEYVEGFYDYGRTRSNKTEAKAIVDEVISRLEAMVPETEGGKAQAPLRSIGIVAFSKVQSGIIEDMLIEALSKRPDLEQLAFKSEEPLFVKNLENVQGDERDIILFSVGYGPDKEGKVSMNFGPLNQAGGERRLNVAVSRARYEMKVFSTLHPEQIDLQRTAAQGVLALKRFLEFAATGTLPSLNTLQQDDAMPPVARQIAEQLRAEGHEVHIGVGRSHFRVDLAIVDPKHPNRYSQGIILDDISYYNTPTARDREVVQPSVLEQLGWRLEHRWTTDLINRL